jgi:hypothetical protein
MNTMESEFTGQFLTMLAAEGRSVEIPESADFYGWLVGDWELRFVIISTWI